MAKLNARFLKYNGFDAHIAFNANDAREFTKKYIPDLFVVDIQLPDEDGLSLCREFRKTMDAPVIFLTGRKEPGDKIAGFNAGGDYYLTKPYVMEEFIAIAQRLLLRADQTRDKIEKAVREASVIKRGALTLQITQSKALVNNRDVGLSPKEFAVLLLLVQNEGRVLSAEAIYGRVWGAAMASDTGTIRQHISRMKKKLGEGVMHDFTILNDYGGSYTFMMK
jgi:DNA-binding response OmpR family regulator